MVRPIGIDAQNEIQPGDQDCEAVGTTCLRVISGISTPMLWRVACAALVAGVWWWLGCRDWRFVVPVLGVLSAWLPWFQFAARSLSFSYAIVLLPFHVMELAMVLGRVLGPANHPKRRTRAMPVGLAIGLVILYFTFIYPILIDGLPTRLEWLSCM